MTIKEDLIDDKADENCGDELKLFYCSHCGAKIVGLIVARYECSAGPGMNGFCVLVVLRGHL